MARSSFGDCIEVPVFTTQARSRAQACPSHWFDLEDPQATAQLAQPLLALQDLRGLLVIDEVQHAPELTKVLRVMIDRPYNPALFLLSGSVGSASPVLLRQSGESLAGRIEVIEAGGLTVDDVGVELASRLWSRGGFSHSLLADGNEASRIWRREFIRTMVERDLPRLGTRVPAPAIQRFRTLQGSTAGAHAQSVLGRLCHGASTAHRQTRPSLFLGHPRWGRWRRCWRSDAKLGTCPHAISKGPTCRTVLGVYGSTDAGAHAS